MFVCACSEDTSSAGTTTQDDTGTAVIEDTGTASSDTQASNTASDVAPDTQMQAEDTASEPDSMAADTAEDTEIEDTGGSEDTSPDVPPLLEEYVLDGEEAYPEAVTFDPVERAFYTASILRGDVLRTEADGSQSVFFPGNMDGQEWLGLGLEVDPERRQLWVCVALGREFSESEIWLLDLENGERLWQTSLESVYEGAACIDMVLADDGTVFVADRQAGNIYRIDADARSVEVLTSDPTLEPEVIGQNGIAITEDERFLLTAKFATPKLARINIENPADVRIIDLVEKSPEPLSGGADALVVLDGLIYIAMHEQIVRVAPNANWTDAQIDVRPLTRANGRPLSGVSGLTVAEGALYASKSDVIGFAIALPPDLPFLLRRIELSIFEE